MTHMINISGFFLELTHPDILFQDIFLSPKQRNI